MILEMVDQSGESTQIRDANEPFDSVWPVDIINRMLSLHIKGQNRRLLVAGAERVEEPGQCGTIVRDERSGAVLHASSVVRKNIRCRSDICTRVEHKFQH